MNLKPLAVKHEAFEGKVVFYNLPYESLETERYMEELGRVTPQFAYIHKVTGEERGEQPEEYREFLVRAEQAREAKQNQIIVANADALLSAEQVGEILATERAVMELCQWSREERWTQRHRVFCMCVPSTIDIEFAEDLPTQAKGLKLFWENRNGSVKHNWELFNQVIGQNAYNEWVLSYSSTRESAMISDAPPKPQGNNDPQSSSDGTTTESA